ncbi:MAG: glycosyltransferase family 2 protein [archaeon]
MTVEVSVILPCRDEELTLEKCIRQIKAVFKNENISGEIIVSDSSGDRSPQIARENNVILVKHDEKGYGNAILKGIEKSSGKLIVIGDADATYDFSEMPLLLRKLKNCDLVVGTRMRGRIDKGAMPLHHRWFGNPILSFILNTFFHTNLSDTHSGFRAIRKNKLKKLDLKSSGMEFASEMIIKAAKSNLKISEVPISYHVRHGSSKLRSISDGWRHLRFMLMLTPTYLFFVPGLLLMLTGLTLMGLTQLHFFPRFELVGMSLSIIGFQVVTLGLFSKIYSIHTGFEKDDWFIDFLAKKITLERGILIAGLMILTGIIGFLPPFRSIVSEIALITLIILGIQFFFSAFFTSIMLVEKIK